MTRRGVLAWVVTGVLVFTLSVPGVFAALSDSTATARSRVTTAALPVAEERAAVGDRVWLDADHDGSQDADEAGVDGVTVTLLDAAGAPVTTDGAGHPVAPQLTQTVLGVAGTYGFDDLAPGGYRLEFSDLPAGHELTLPGATPGDGTDSDPDPVDGRTAVVDLAPGEHDRTVDAGIWVPAPALAVDKRVQGLAADEAPGPSLPVGGTATFDYLVTNTGNEALEALVVVDDRGVAVTCPQATVAVGETVPCAGSDTVVLGAYENTGTATATGQDSGQQVSAQDRAHYTGVAPGLDVELAVDGQDADSAAEAVDVRVGAPLTYSVQVTNTGAATIEAIAVTDGAGGSVSCPADTLAPGGSMACADRTVAAPAGPHTEVVAAVGATTPGGESVSDTDPAHHRGLTPALTLLKEVLDPASGTYRDADADAATPGSNDGVVPTLAAGATARFRLTATNTGDLGLTGVEVADDRCDAPPTVVAGDAAPVGVLDVGETWRLTCSVAEVTVAFTNTATVHAASTVGPPDGHLATERAAVDVAGPASVAVVKQVQDPATGTFGEGATLVAGATATFRLQITNDGEAPLVDVAVTDPLAPECARTFAGPLAPGASTPRWTCSRAGVDLGFTNVAAVTARPATGAAAVTASDDATVSVRVPLAPDLRLDKALTDHTGGSATFRLTVTNHGPGAAPGPITVVDELPDGLTFRSATGTGWRCAHRTGTVTCTRAAALAEGGSSTVFLETAIDAGAPATVRNGAVLAGVTDADPANNADSAVLDTTATPAPGPGAEPQGGVPDPGAGRLAVTGVEVVGLVLLGLGLLGAGAVALLAAKRRRAEPYRPLP